MTFFLEEKFVSVLGMNRPDVQKYNEIKLNMFHVSKLDKLTIFRQHE